MQGALFHLVAGQKNGKFVTAKTRCAVQRRQQRLELQRELFENSVACGMAKIVVDRLEPVEVDEEAGEFAAVAVRIADLQIENGLEALTVEEAGQMVGNGLLAIALFRLAQFGHVGHGAEACALMRRIAGIKGLFEDECVHDAAIHAMETHGDAAMRSIGQGVRRLALLKQKPVVGVDEIGKIQPEYPSAVVARRLHPIVTDGGDAVVPVE
ncbi:hypothetical protein GGE40_000322 [Agrobacterium tumefaciens]|uniref:Uncharacterized protein n=1 Tax=Agrobacterium radiobacter TaxID=362 RepID=A0ABR6J0U3_AGRRD|nr:hypothetical protein [Agrobacterium radiobacter]